LSSLVSPRQVSQARTVLPSLRRPSLESRRRSCGTVRLAKSSVPLRQRGLDARTEPGRFSRTFRFFGARQSTRKTTAPLSNHNRGSVVSPAEVTTLRRSSFSAVEQPVRLLKAVGLSSHRAVQRSPHLYPFFRYISQRELESSRRKPPSKGGKIEAAH